MNDEQVHDALALYGDLVGDLQNYLDVPYRIVIEFGRKRMAVREILNLTVESVVSIPKSAGENVDVLANDRIIAHGEIITVEESTGVVITDIAFV